MSADQRERLADRSPSPAEIVEGQEALERLIASSPRYGPIILMLAEGYTHQEIAERVGCTERTVERTVERLLQLPRWLSSADPQ